MNRIFKYIESAGIATALVVALLCSCSDNEISRTQTEVSISYPADAEGLTIVSEEIKAVNLSTGQTQILPSKSKIDIVSGLYDFIYSAEVRFSSSNGTETSTMKGTLSGKAENVSITQSPCNVNIETFLSAENDDFIIEEIFFTGTLRPSGSAYYG
ncbi:MAG: hypothetical protein IJT89_12050, partial [Bacteroidaceae bacterium]|nr:hypothetical protein [Bacteroidaceae bacterium]